MLNLKKEATTLSTSEINLGQCPVCHGYVSHLYFMQDATTKKQSKWYSCSCGVVWQVDKPSAPPKVIDLTDQKLKDSYDYVVRLYCPLIEELLYGRRALVVGSPSEHFVSALRERGWVASSLDNGFDTTDIAPNSINMIWFYHSLEALDNPVSVLANARSMLTEDGILVIVGPDTDFIHTRGSSLFRHWRPDHHYLMWNRASLSKQLESLGFNVVMARQNCWQRFPETDDLHLIAQVKFF